MESENNTTKKTGISYTEEDRKKFILAQHEVITDLILEKSQISQDLVKLQNKLADALQEVDLRTLDYQRACEERDAALTKVKNQSERISYLEGATNHAGGTPLSIALQELDIAKAATRTVAEHAEDELHKLAIERDEALLEVRKLRELYPKILKALENGSACASGSSLEFLQEIPLEVSIVVQDLKKSRDVYKMVAQELIAAIRINTLRQTWSKASPEDLDAWLEPWISRLEKTK